LLAQAITQDESNVFRELISLTKPRLSSLVLVTAGVGILVAPGSFSAARSLLTLVAIVMVVGAANALNCYIERKSDGLMHRTRGRALPAGRLSPPAAVYFGGALLLVSLPVLAVVANPLTAALGVLATLLYVFAYTPLKYRSSLALQVGAVPGAIPPLMGVTAVTGSVGSEGLALFALLFCWQFTHFLAISLYLKEDYARAGIQTYSLVHGEKRTKVMISVSMLFLIPITVLPVTLGMAPVMYGVVATLLGGALLGWSLIGFGTPTTGRWARRTFLATVYYLPLLLTALVIGVAKN
jgi:protoheme IX farnesyltransferase